ncbi:hypothetical protein JCM3765_006240 [Sporobolomyces pararoseus]
MSALLDPASKVEVALKQLDVAYVRARMHCSAKVRSRLDWIILVQRIATRAATYRWTEMAQGDVSKLEAWKSHLDEEQNLEKIPDWKDILDTSIGLLLERSFSFYRFYLEQIAQEDEASPFGSDQHSKLIKKGATHWTSDRKNLCNNVTEEEWESDLVKDERRHVWLLLETKNDPSTLLEKIRQKAASGKTHSLGRTAPMRSRQRSMYYGRL